MAFATRVTIGTGNKVTQSYQSQDVSVSVTYELERSDTDLIAFMAAKAAEVEACHTAVWQGIFAKRMERGMTEAPEDQETTPPSPGSQPKRPRKADRPQAMGDGSQAHAPSQRVDGGGPTSAGPREVPAPDEPKPRDTQAEAHQPDSHAPSVTQDASSPAGAQDDIPTVPQRQQGVQDIQAFEPASNVQKIAIRHLAARKGHTPQSLTEVLREIYSKGSLDDLTKPEAKELLASIERGALDLPASPAAEVEQAA
ncbi:MAG: hypothetical protein KGL39_55650 [Patescibacteria group bacterium]|nr:hypothetical protein [Patescibacteria group bacterium]